LGKKYLNPFVFFFIKDDQLAIWDYKNHQQFEIERMYFDRLLAIAKGDESDAPIDEELLEANLISNSKNDIEWGWDLLSKIFHVGIQNLHVSIDADDHQNQMRDYMEFCEEIFSGIPNMYTERSGSKFKLPEPDLSLLSKSDFWSVLKNRKTCRSFDGKPLSLITISTLMYAVFGNIHPEWADLKEYDLSEISIRKSSPSAGGIHSSEAYLIALNIEGIVPGIYHYESHNHLLTLIDDYDCKSKLGYLLAEQCFAERLSAGVFISARLEKNWHKYRHSRGYSHVLLDIGHLSQTFQLCVTAMGFYPWLTSAFTDSEVSKLLRIDGTTEYPMFFVGVGNGDGHSLSQEMRNYLQSKK